MQRTQSHSRLRRLFQAALQALTGILLMTTLTTPATAQPLRGLDNPTLALNVSNVRDYLPGMQFLDIMKIAREWIGHEPGKWGGTTADELEAGGYLDENGWPTEIPELCQRDP